MRDAKGKASEDLLSATGYPEDDLYCSSVSTVFVRSSSMEDLFFADGLDPAQIGAEAAKYGPLTQSVRRLMEAAALTDADDDTVAAARKAIDVVTTRLAAKRVTSLGIRIGRDGDRRMWGNALTGLRNPMAPPVEFEHGRSGLVWTRLSLGPIYEGVPGIVHGGFIAMILDHLLGEAAEAGGTPGMTGTLTVRYRRPLPLGPLYAEARADVAAGRKISVSGWISTHNGGDVCASAEGIYVTPRWPAE